MCVLRTQSGAQQQGTEVAGKASIMSFLSDFLWGQVPGQLGDSRSLSSLAAGAAAPPFLDPSLWARHCTKHHTSCSIFTNLIVQMWKLRPRLREVSNLLTHNKQEERRDLTPGPLCLLPEGKALQNLPTPAFPSQAFPGTCGLWSVLSVGSDSANDLGHSLAFPGPQFTPLGAFLKAVEGGTRSQ